MIGRLIGLCIVAGSTALLAADKPEVRFEKQVLTDKFFAEGAAFGDFNHDGEMDIVAGPFWWEGPQFTAQHAYYPPKPFDPLVYSDNFSAYVYDINGDEWDDIVVIPFPGVEGFWYENPEGKEGNWVRRVTIPAVDNESPTFTDLTGDGQPELICSTDGYFGFATPDWKDPAKPWTFHRISDQSAGGKFTHGLGVGDVNGDGRLDLLEKSGWWEQPEELTGDPQWKKHPFEFSQAGGAHMYVDDINGDGRNDVITSLAAHGYGLVWWEQMAGEGEPKFEQRLIIGAKPEESKHGVSFSQPHAIDFVDIDGDGLKDIITGKRFWAHGPKGDAEPNAAAVLYWFQRTRAADGSVDWVPHLIDDDSGIGTQVMAGDFTGDGMPDVVVGNKKGVFVHRQISNREPRTK
jgi:hypothetical protein